MSKYVYIISMDRKDCWGVVYLGKFVTLKVNNINQNVHSFSLTVDFAQKHNTRKEAESVLNDISHKDIYKKIHDHFKNFRVRKVKVTKVVTYSLVNERKKI